MLVGSVPAAVPVAPEVLCTVDDPRLEELSGLVVDDAGMWAMADGGRSVQVLRIDPSTCAVEAKRTADIDPFDAEDLARGPNGSLWVSDTGDNNHARETVAVIVLPARGAAQLHRLTYPDGPHDAEALLVDSAGRPVVITKELGRAGVYRTAEPPSGTGPTPMVRIGQVSLPRSDTVGGPVQGFSLVTGAAESADGRVIALRTYTDAWLYAVPDGDLVAALQSEPVQVPLPDEPQGEAVAFEPDGTLVSGSETRSGVAGQVRAVPGAAALVAETPAAAAPARDAASDGVIEPSGPDWLPAAIGAAALVGVLLIIALVMAVHGARRRSRPRSRR